MISAQNHFGKKIAQEIKKLAICPARIYIHTGLMAQEERAVEYPEPHQKAGTGRRMYAFEELN